MPEYKLQFPDSERFFDVYREKEHGMQQPCDSRCADLPGHAYARSLAKTDIACQCGHFV